MKKQLLLAILVLCMVLTILPMTASAAETGLPNVYLGGAWYGNDSNDGSTVATAVKTFAKAKELVSDTGTIWITGTLMVSDDQTWDLSEKSGVTLKRDPCDNAGGSLIGVLGTGSLTLKNVVLDAAMRKSYDEVDPDTKTFVAVSVQDSAKLIMDCGSVIENVNSDTSGGAVQVLHNATFTMKGNAELRNNKTTKDGAAICSHMGTGSGTTINITESASITGNSASITGNTAGDGGGIYSDNGTVNISGGTISNNTATGSGGGIAAHGIFHMTGGTISENTAKYGGGLFTESTKSETDFTITGGTIENNAATDTTIGPGNNIFVNGSKVSLSGDWESSDGIYLNKDTSRLYFTSALKNPLELEGVRNAAAGRVVAKGSNYTLTKDDNAKLSYKENAFIFSLDSTNNEIKLAEHPKYDLWVADTQATGKNASDILGDGKVSYDVDSNTLTLNNATIINEMSGYTGIRVPDGITIKLVGNNTLTNNSSRAIEGDGALSIIGDGKLTVNIKKQFSNNLSGSGIFASGTITITDSTLEIKNQNTQDKAPFGLESSNDGDVVASGANITIDGTKGAAISVSEGGATFTETTLNITDAEGDGINCVTGDIMIKDSEINTDNTGLGITTAGSLVTIDNSKVKASSDTKNGIFSEGEIVIKNASEVTAEGNWPALYATSNLEMSGGTIEATSTNRDAIYSVGTITMKDSTVHAKGATGYVAIRARAIQAGSEVATPKIILDNLIEKNGGKVAFSNWFSHSDSGQTRSWTTFIDKNDSEIIMNADNGITNGLSEVWLAAPYTVTFNANGGVGSDVKTLVYPQNKVTAPTAGFTKEGYTLKGWLKQDNTSFDFANTSITADLTLKAKWADETAPAVKISMGTKNWSTFIYNITFGLFSKKTETITIDATDKGSGIHKVYYYLSDTALNEEAIKALPDGSWTEGSSKNVSPKWKGFIYAKATDVDGNSTYVSSDGGIVIYEDAAQETSKISFMKTETTDIIAKVKLNGNTIKEIKNDTATLKKDTDYTVSNSTITFKAAYLDSLTAGNYNLTVSYNPMGEAYAAGSDNEEPNTTTLSLTVNKADQAALSISSPTTAIQNKSYTATTTGGSGDGAITYTITQGNDIATLKGNTFTFTKAGTVKFTATKAGNDSYRPITSEEFTLTVKEPAPTITVDGNEENIGKVETTDDTTTVVIDQTKFPEKIDSAKDGSEVVVSVVDETKTSVATIVVKNIEDMAKKNMTFVVASGNVRYNLDTTAVNTAAIAKELGITDTSKIPFTVSVTTKDPKAVTPPAGTTLIGNPMDFTVTASYGDKEVSVETFKSYINRSVEITEEQSKRITTGLTYNEDGSTRHVPTYVYQKDGKWYAEINSLTNSTYILIENEVTFKDAANNWFEDIVNEMGSRQIIFGLDENNFAGNQLVTRAEFAAIMVRALGLPATGNGSMFKDVAADQWYAGAVDTAYRYGLIVGMGDNTFAPMSTITREQAMLIVQNAAKLTPFKGESSSLTKFSDAAKVSKWAEDAVKWNVGSGLIVGYNNQLNPKDSISRAESATVILKLLQKAELVDVRS